ncbi:MAG: hypothetical protein RMK17_02610, partial [bacterium]|nr:hypothetical protein [bacterium]
MFFYKNKNLIVGLGFFVVFIALIYIYYYDNRPKFINFRDNVLKTSKFGEISKTVVYDNIKSIELKELPLDLNFLLLPDMVDIVMQKIIYQDNRVGFLLVGSFSDKDLYSN